MATHFVQVAWAKDGTEQEQVHSLALDCSYLKMPPNKKYMSLGGITLEWCPYITIGCVRVLGLLSRENVVLTASKFLNKCFFGQVASVSPVVCWSIPETVKAFELSRLVFFKLFFLCGPL